VPSAPPARPGVCAGCGTEVAPALLTCPRCQRLVHAEALRQLAADAEKADAAGDLVGARDAWKRALDRLPPASRQAEAVLERVAALNRKLEAGPPVPAGGGMAGRALRLGSVGALGLLLWKFKFAVVFVVTKGKLLVMGLTKTSTLLTMALSLGVYWTAWGWMFALGLVLSMYVHEMGHVAALQRYGIKATAPMFVPGLGAFVRLKEYPASPAEDARVGLAGPLWGLGAALAAYAVFLATASPYWAAVARTGAWLNLFNLMPIWQLDGGRGFRALTRGQRLLVVLAFGAAWAVAQDGLFLLLAIAGAMRVAAEEGARAPDQGVLAEFTFLVAAFAVLFRVAKP
jgi:Zn-dependent protease